MMRIDVWDKFIREHDYFMVFAKTDRLNWLVEFLRNNNVDKDKIWILPATYDGIEMDDINGETVSELMKICC